MSIYEGPICENNKVVSWFCSWECKNRVYPLDMAAFAINLRVLSNSQIYFEPYGLPGFMESQFLEKFKISLDMFECNSELSKKVK
jgi:hypothetical protein